MFSAEKVLDLLGIVISSFSNLIEILDRSIISVLTVDNVQLNVILAPARSIARWLQIGDVTLLEFLLGYLLFAYVVLTLGKFVVSIFS